MSKHASDVGFRQAVANAILRAIRARGLTKSRAAELLGIERQTLWLYLNEKATPGGEVLRKAFEMWDLRIELGNCVITKESFGPKLDAGQRVAEQMSFLDQLEKLRSDQLELTPMGRGGEYFEFKIRIKATTTRR